MRVRLEISSRTWPLREPFVISRATYHHCEVIVARIEAGACVGRGEAVGVDYHGESPASMIAQLEGVRAQIESGVSRVELQELLPPGGARNAVDCALWDLESKRSGKRAWELAGIPAAHPVVTTETIGIRSVSAYEEKARQLSAFEWLKIKVDARHPIECVRAVRRGSPGAKLVVDANQAWSVRELVELAPELAALRVDLLEQPVPVDADDELAHVEIPIPVCADEPVNTVADLPRICARYDYVNVKLDKSGGLTAGLELARAARSAGMKLMVGCMVGGSVAMAPGMVLAQLCEIADLDGPLLQSDDWRDPIIYTNGVMSLPSRALWG